MLEKPENITPVKAPLPMKVTEFDVILTRVTRLETLSLMAESTLEQIRRDIRLALWIAGFGVLGGIMLVWTFLLRPVGFD